VTKKTKKENKRKSKMMNLNQPNLKLKSMIIKLMTSVKDVNGRDFKKIVKASWESCRTNNKTFFKCPYFLSQINRLRI
jgi:hypothetical protein